MSAAISDESVVGDERVLIVIVNYRTASLAVACLQSLAVELASHPHARVVVVDNDSGDGSMAQLRAAIDGAGWGSWVELVASAVNGGFAAGNNLGIRTALRRGLRPSHVWLVNPDAEVRPGALDVLLQFMAQHPRAGIAGGCLESPSGEVWPYAFRFPSIWSEIDSGLRLGVVSRMVARHAALRRMGEAPEPVDWICGANFMIRGQLLDRIGLMDEDYFLYFEEVDYCLQARRAGWQCWFVPAARVMHIAGQSSGISSADLAPPRRPAYWFESRRRYFVKNHGRVYAWLTDLAWLGSFSSWRLRRRLQGKTDVDPPQMLADFARHSLLVQPFVQVRDAAAVRATDSFQ